MSGDDLIEQIRAFADAMKARGAQYRIEVQETPSDTFRLSSTAFVERDRPVNQTLDEASDEDLIDELRDRLEDRA